MWESFFLVKTGVWAFVFDLFSLAIWVLNGINGSSPRAEAKRVAVRHRALPETYACMYMYVCICMYAYACMCACVLVHGRMHVCMRVHVCICVYVYMRMHVRMCICASMLR